MKKIIHSILLFCSLLSSSVFAQNNFLDFDGADDYVSMPDPLNLNSNTVTIEAWIYPDGVQTAATGIVFSRGGSTTAGLNIGWLNNNRIGYHWNGAPNTYNWTGGPSYNTNVWQHIALVIEPAKATIYWNGTPHINNFPNAIEEFDEVLKISDDDCCPNRHFNGLIDEVRIWDVARSSAEINANMNTELTGNETNLVAYYNFNQGNCGIDNSSIPVPQITDIAGSRNGTLQNFDLPTTEDGDGCTSNIVCATPTCPYPDNGLLPPSGAAVPTLGQWGLILLTLLLLIFGTIAIRSRQLVLAGTRNSNATFRQLPYDKMLFVKILLPLSVLVLAIFSIAVSLFGYELTLADIPGSLIAVPLLAYLLHLLGGEDR